MNAIFRFYQSDVLDLCPFLDSRRCAFHLEILNNNDRISINQDIAVHILIHLFCHIFGLKFKTTLRANKNAAVRIHILTIALRTIR